MTNTTVTITISADNTGTSSMVKVPLAALPAIEGALSVGADGVEDGHEVEVFRLISAIHNTWSHSGNQVLATVTDIKGD